MLRHKEQAAGATIIWSQVTAAGSSSSLRHLNKKAVVNFEDASLPIYCAVPTGKQLLTFAFISSAHSSRTQQSLGTPRLVFLLHIL